MSDSDQGSSAKKTKGDDVALICGRTRDGTGLNIVRKRDDCVEVGTVQPLKEGKAIHGEVVRLVPRKDTPLLCDVEVQWTTPEATGQASRRPAQVATDTYRRNWDTIWPSRSARSELN